MVKDALAERDLLIHRQRQLIIQAGAALDAVLNEDELEEGHVVFMQATLHHILLHLRQTSPDPDEPP